MSHHCATGPECPRVGSSFETVYVVWRKLVVGVFATRAKAEEHARLLSTEDVEPSFTVSEWVVGK